MDLQPARPLHFFLLPTGPENIVYTGWLFVVAIINNITTREGHCCIGLCCMSVRCAFTI